MLIFLVMALLTTAACTSTLRAGKAGTDFILGSSSDTGHALLCESGDLQRVLGDTTLTESVKDALMQHICLRARSSEKTRQLYRSLTDEQQKDLLRAFKRHGYDVYAACG